MDLRLALYDLAAKHQLDAPASAQLKRLAGVGQEPAALAHWLPRGLAIVGAALGGLGVIFWIAANWGALGRSGCFALLQGLFGATCAGALLLPTARVPLALLAMLSIGALFAYFGQTYPSGADAWQLFALWAGLSLPLCLAVRSDVLWAPWTVLALSALALHTYAMTEHSWRIASSDFAAHGGAFGLAMLLSLVFSQPCRSVTGAAPWALRAAVAQAALFIATVALVSLFAGDGMAQYWLGGVVLLAAAWALTRPRLFDMFSLSALALGINVLFVCGMGRLLLDYNHTGIYGWLLPLALLGVLAAGALAGTVRLLMALARRGDREGAPA